VRWVSGIPAVDAGPADRGNAADGLAAFLLSLHVPAEPDVAPKSCPRGAAGGPEPVVMERLGDRERHHRAAELKAAWTDACTAAAWGGTAVMLHGDLHPANILLASDGTLSGVIDFGDVGAGDPEVDLAVGWLMFDAGTRQRFNGAFGSSVDRDTWARARGWALVLSTAMLSNSDDNPRMFSVGEFGMEEVLEG